MERDLRLHNTLPTHRKGKKGVSGNTEQRMRTKFTAWSDSIYCPLPVVPQPPSKLLAVVSIMRPLMLHGHDRSITQIRYNLEGDLLFSVAKDSKPTVWYSSNGERLGTFNGHNGAVWCVDISRDSTRVLTGSADNSAKLWDCETGKELNQFETGSAVRSCMFSYSGNLLEYTTDSTMGTTCEIILYDIRDLEAPVRKIPVEGSKVTASLWGPFDEFLITGHETGEVCRYDVVRSGHCLQSIKEHKGPISDLQASSDHIMIISACKDHTASLLDAENLELVKTFRTERPVNSAAISPIKDHVVLGGGQEARDVTTTTTKSGKFDARFYHLVYEEEIGRVKGHFGPINSLKFHPDGKSYSSGGEDGYIRVHTFDSSYFEFEF